MSSKPSLCLVTPALADANNGNWQTARRWSRLLRDHYAVRLAIGWPDAAEAQQPAALLLALHARRSAASIAAWALAHPARPLVVALTGTDLYRDIETDRDAQRSLRLATRLIVLQDQGALALPATLRARCDVVVQSTTSRQTLAKTGRRLRAVVVGHLRDEKSPQTIFAAARLLSPHEGITIDHIGLALDPALDAAAQHTAAVCPHYRWLGGMTHAQTRRRIQQAHVLLHPSRMEGGAHVIMEAVCSGTPVLASHIPGNVGMLGAGYGGYFPQGDADAVANLLRQARAGQRGQSPDMLAALHAQCGHRASLFAPESERAALLQSLRTAQATLSGEHP